ncbi:hypothetical protein J3F83DRAFT_340863 [Trichoderma novae-zelandiae]
MHATSIYRFTWISSVCKKKVQLGFLVSLLVTMSVYSHPSAFLLLALLYPFTPCHVSLLSAANCFFNAGDTHTHTHIRPTVHHLLQFQSSKLQAPSP